MELDEVLRQLEQLGDPETKKVKARFAIIAENSHGIFMKDLDGLARKIGKNDALALQLFDTGVYEARLLTSKVFQPKNITEPLMEKWVSVFDNWEICDTFCMGFMGRSPFALSKALAWTEREPEYQRRAGFALIAAYSLTNKDAGNEVFRQFFPIMIKHANDDRKYVMKGINWALRQVGKRNRDLHQEAIATAKDILALDTKPARWIAKDALRQLQQPKIAFKNYPREIYGK